ncbi:hypothetical protein DMP06_01450 [Slackia equolifaciens]|uniref:DUF4143 domain-containing protein n=1 Tax=Slackia equolifaciens TaxID=498718 RepID=A0A3N0B4Q5_9ACTN|nr:hypothetical protein [Slackia equolifaciens]RNL42101.1 hypothetical protein DMP06_01450 [Slackia equolifaciens]
MTPGFEKFLPRTNDKKEIDLLLEQNGALFPIEVKKSSLPKPHDAKNFNALSPVNRSDVPAELASLKREIGCGSVVCLASDAFPLTENIWSFPVWAI